MAAHPIHPAIVHFPIGALGIGALVDALILFGTLPPEYWGASSKLIALGLVFSLAAIVLGAYDTYLLNKSLPRLVGKAVLHASVMTTACCLYLLVRYKSGELLPVSTLPAMVSMIGFSTLIFGGYLGGDLVYRHGANVSTRKGK
jgi:uncharacterized membrane protein